MKRYPLAIITLVFAILSCADKTQTEKHVSEKEQQAFDFGTWIKEAIKETKSKI